MLFKTFLILLGVFWCSFQALGLELPAGTAKVVFYDREGRPLKALEDQDGDGRFETVFYFETGQLKKRLKLAREGVPEEILLYDRKGRPLKLILDRNRDGRPDKWQDYSCGRPTSLEEDRNFDGRVDLRVELKGESPRKILRDEDYDGCFEIEELFLAREKELRLRKIKDQKTCKGRVYARIFYHQGELRRRLLDLDGDGSFETEEIYRAGKRCLVLKRGKGLEAFWYEGAKEPKFSFEDLDGDGKFERRYNFSQGTWKTLKPAPDLQELREKCR